MMEYRIFHDKDGRLMIIYFNGLEVYRLFRGVSYCKNATEFEIVAKGIGQKRIREITDTHGYIEVPAEIEL